MPMIDSSEVSDRCTHLRRALDVAEPIDLKPNGHVKESAEPTIALSSLPYHLELPCG